MGHLVGCYVIDIAWQPDILVINMVDNKKCEDGTSLTSGIIVLESDTERWE